MHFKRSLQKNHRSVIKRYDNHVLGNMALCHDHRLSHHPNHERNKDQNLAVGPKASRRPDLPRKSKPCDKLPRKKPLPSLLPLSIRCIHLLGLDTRRGQIYMQEILPIQKRRRVLSPFRPPLPNDRMRRRTQIVRVCLIIVKAAMLSLITIFISLL